VINDVILDIDGGSVSISIDNQQANSGAIAATASNANNSQPADFSGSTVNQEHSMQVQTLGNFIIKNIIFNGNIVESSAVTVINNQSNVGATAAIASNAINALQTTGWSASMATRNGSMMAQASGNSLSNNIVLNATPQIVAGTALNASK
jgi:hypothetical protein